MSFSSRIRHKGALFGLILATAACVPLSNAAADADVEAAYFAEAYARNKRVAENPNALMRADAAKKVAEHEKSQPAKP